MKTVIKSSYKHHGEDGQATAKLTLIYEGDNDTRDRLLNAIHQALNPVEALEEKTPQLGFATGEE